MTKLKKWGKRFFTALWYLMVITLGLVLFNVASAKYHHEIPRIMGYSIFRITTGSMEPTIPTGMYILIRDAEPEEIREGDIITFYSVDLDIANKPNTHRVSAPPEKTPIGLRFQTRGDANYIDDQYMVLEDHLIGKYCRNLPILTEVVNFFMTKGVLICLIAVQALSLFMMGFSVKLLRSKKKEVQKTKEETETALREEIARKAVEEFIASQSQPGDARTVPEKSAESTEETGEEPAVVPEEPSDQKSEEENG